MVFSQSSLFDSVQYEKIILDHGELWWIPNWLSSDEADNFFQILNKETQWQQSTIRIANQNKLIPRLNAWYGDKGASYRYSGVHFNPLPMTETLSTLKQRVEESYQSIISEKFNELQKTVNSNYGDEPETFSKAISNRKNSSIRKNKSNSTNKTKPDQLVQNELSGINQSIAFNSALLNLYRDGNDSVAWHADDEPELGPSPQIASISLGESRRFLLKPNRKKFSAAENSVSQRQKTIELDLTSGSLLFMLDDLQQYWLHSVPKQRGCANARINVTFRQVFSTQQSVCPLYKS